MIRHLLAALHPAAPTSVPAGPPPVELATAEDLAALQAQLNRANRAAELATTRAELLQQSNDRLIEQVHAAQRHAARAAAQADALATRISSQPAREELLRAHATIRALLGRLEAHEGRPSDIACPRACCAPAPIGAIL